jgi:CheY-like chemotaxis protein
MAATDTILVVEDHKSAREALATILQREGFAVALATNGQEALDYLRSQPTPRVILLDMLLPVLDGWHFLEQLKLLDLMPWPRVVVTTGSPSIGREWARAHGCDGFVRKPIDPDVLLAEIRAP